MDISTSQDTSQLHIRYGSSLSNDVDFAVREVVERINHPNSAFNILFFSGKYDRPALGRKLMDNLSGPVVGCSSAGQLSMDGFQRGGLSGISLSSDLLQPIPYLISPLSSVTEQSKKIAEDVHKRISESGANAFGFLLVDGLSEREESLTAALYRALGDVPIIGGSAGDMLEFKETHVLYQGIMYQDAAVFTLFISKLPFTTFKHQHFQRTSTRLVITEASPNQRLVHEINGERAVDAYAKAISVSVSDLTPGIFSKHPLMLKIRDDNFIRSIASIKPDGSLKFYCAIDKGLVVAVAEGVRPIEAMEKDFKEIKNKIGEPEIILSCDCILRRLEMEDLGITAEIKRMFAENNIFGFSTFGEQFNSVHVNQTFTGVAIARNIS